MVVQLSNKDRVADKLLTLAVQSIELIALLEQIRMV